MNKNKQTHFIQWLIHKKIVSEGCAISYDSYVRNALSAIKVDIKSLHTKESLKDITEMLSKEGMDEKLQKAPNTIQNYLSGLRAYGEFLDTAFSEEYECNKTLPEKPIDILLPQNNVFFMNKKLHHNTLVLLPLKDLAHKKFIIGSYQRGYKWGKKEILELLNDIHSFDKNMGMYCLQPLILKSLEIIQPKIQTDSTEIHQKNEVVDGQQRTTTIYLILRYLEHKKWIESNSLYEIDFQTRERSGYYLKNNLDTIYSLDLRSIKDDEFIEFNYADQNAVNTLWSQYISEHMEYNNVDIYHFFIVSCYLIRWIEINLKDKGERNNFIEKFTESVKVIWYSLEASQNHDEIIKVFLNNNKGKISLTSSELIKALFILDIKNREPESIAVLKINEFATEWDGVEKQLQNERFWYFIQPDESKYKQGTRIDFLFDLELQKCKNSDSYFAYREIESSFNKNENIGNSWDQVLRLHYKFINWFEDKELYHFIGFLTNSRIKNLDEILEISKGSNRDKFKEDLMEIVRVEFDKTVERDKIKHKPYLLDNLNYKYFYNETMNVLLLYNVFYYLENMAGYKFPFDLYVKQQWSIEHINPQNPKGFESMEIYTQWITDMHLYAEKPLQDELIDELKKLDIDELDKNKALMKLIEDFSKEIEETTHSVDNLLLLDKNTNSALGNKSFKDKRIKILEFDKRGYNDDKEPVFIPIETLNAFNKIFSDNVNIESWTKEDGDSYCKAIAQRLKGYLPTNI
ncbi:DUF262 domain-containing protein [Chryseobacterium sp. Mn2064]|uniref:DUF262 domain-containing protein n=1 Tax=Chryseobacterium sp. Mn2064 TaxID=3395263 RepID=UPI003BD49468